MPVTNCAVCRKRGRAILVDYHTILTSMGYVGYRLAHTKCVTKLQQLALNLKKGFRGLLLRAEYWNHKKEIKKNLSIWKHFAGWANSDAGKYYVDHYAHYANTIKAVEASLEEPQHTECWLEGLRRKEGENDED